MTVECVAAVFINCHDTIQNWGMHSLSVKISVKISVENNLPVADIIPTTLWLELSLSGHEIC